MEYLVGSAFTVLLCYFLFKNFISTIMPTPKIKISYGQSSIHEQIKHFLPPVSQLMIPKITQSSKYHENKNVKVIIIDGNAYWIKDNKFYTATVRDKGIDKDEAVIVDTMAMDKVELDKMLFIMDKLREGKNHDSGSSGN
jgi:hypothetical protein